jgi:prepilin-type N-terminal cleavage/methylation domain-containing protein
MHVQQFRQWKKGQRGFTLLEVLVVLVVMGFLVAMVAPRLSGISQDSIQTIGDTGKNAGERLIAAFAEREGRYPSGLVNLVMTDSSVTNYRYQIPYADNENFDDGPEVIRFNHNNNHKFVIHYLNADEAKELIELGVSAVYNLNHYGEVLNDPAVSAGQTVGRRGDANHTNRTSNWANVTVVAEADKRPKMERVVPAAGVGVAMAVAGAQTRGSNVFSYVGAVRPPSAPRADSFGRIVFGLGPESELVTSGMATKAGVTPVASMTENYTWDGYYVLMPRLKATSARFKASGTTFANIVTGGSSRNFHANFTTSTHDDYGKIVVVGYPKGTSLTPGQIVNGAGALQPGVDGYARRVVDLLEPHSPWDFVSMPNEEDLRWSLVFNMGSLP